MRMLSITLVAILFLSTAAIGQDSLLESSKPSKSLTSVALVLEVKGDVKIKRSEGSRLLKQLNVLAEGDQLVLGGKSSVKIVLLSDKHFEVINGKSFVRVLRTGCVEDAGPQGTNFQARSAPSTPPQMPTSVQRFPKLDSSDARSKGIPQFQNGKSAAVVFRSESVIEKPAEVVPINGSSILMQRPRFSWPKTEPGEFTITVFAVGSGRKVWQEDVKTNSCPYPSDSRELKRNRMYRWVVVKKRSPEAVVCIGEFSVLGLDEVEALQNIPALTDSSNDGEILLRALGFAAYGVYGEALACLELLDEKPHFGEELSSFYRELRYLAGQQKDVSNLPLQDDQKSQAEKTPEGDLKDQ